MRAKVFWKSGAIECHETQPQGYLELASDCYYEDSEGIHLEVGTLDKCTNRDMKQWEGNVPTKHVIVPADLKHEIAMIMLDDKLVYTDEEYIGEVVDKVVESLTS